MIYIHFLAFGSAPVFFALNIQLPIYHEDDDDL